MEQNIFLFDNTLKYNICLEKHVDDDDFCRIIHLTGLDNVETILPEGADSFIGENGKLISGGEKQRVAIARALARGADLMLADEATSALDVQNANNINNIILSDPDRMAIVISHRYDRKILQRFDEIIIMNNGGIAAHGDYESIIMRY